MSDTKTYTERDIVLAKREGYVVGVRDGRTDHGPRWTCDAINIRARKIYPLPKVKRPRVEADPHNHEPQWGKPREWACLDGRTLVSRTIGWWHKDGREPEPFKWSDRAQVPPTRARVALWADLLAHPTEEVEAES